MPTPDEIRGRRFLVTLRGYDRAEVSAFLTEVADEVTRLAHRTTELETRLARRRETGAGWDTDSPRTDAVSEGTPQTPRALAAAEEAAAQLEADAATTARITVEGARATARQIIDGANGQAARIVAEAQRRRDAVAAEIQELRRQRDGFADELRGAIARLAAQVDRLASGDVAPAGRGAPEAADTNHRPDIEATTDLF